MLLLLITTFVGLLSPHTSYVSKLILRCFNRITHRERELLSKRNRLKKEQSDLSNVKDFVLFSKLQRKINVIEQELSETSTERNSGKFVYSIAFNYCLRIVTCVLMLFLSIFYRKVPVFILDLKYDLYPFGGLISFPNDYVNAVSVHFWMICCSRVASLFQT